MSRIVGVRNLHIAELTKDDNTGATYETPQAVPSLISIDIKDNSDSVTFYSDDVAEQTINTFAGKEVTIELGYLSNELEALLTGNKIENGVFIQDNDIQSKEFALLFQAPLSKGGFQYVCLYKGVLNRTESAFKTKEDGVEAQTISLTGVFSPLQFNGKVFAKTNTGDTGNAEAIKTWFTSVPVSIPSGSEARATIKK